MKRNKLVASILVFVIFMLGAVYAKAQEAFVFGSGRQDISIQGANGWYYMYSTAHNQGDTFPVDTIKECVIGQTGWQAWGAPNSWVPNEPIFTTDERFKKWFRIHQDGMVRAGAMMTAALMWRAPGDGEYNVKGKFWGGLADEAVKWDHPGSDGVTFSIYHGSKRLVSKNSGAEKIEELFDIKVTLKKGESLFFICDPNLDDWDDSFWEIDIIPVIETVNEPEPSPVDEPVKQEPRPAEKPAKEELTPVVEPVKEEPRPAEEPVKEEPTPAEKPAEEEPVKEEPVVADEPVKQEPERIDEPVEEPIPVSAEDIVATPDNDNASAIVLISSLAAAGVIALAAYLIIKKIRS